MAVTIERCYRRELVRSICTDPAIYPHIADDYHPAPAAWEVPDMRHYQFYTAADPLGVFGFGAFHPRNLACWEAHCGFLPRAYGAPAIAAIRKMLEIMLGSVAYRIVGEIPIDNRRAIAFAKRAGLVEYGVNEKSIKRGGKLVDQVCLGISKG